MFNSFLQTMVKQMNKQEIITVLEELNKISGFRVSLHDADYNEIAAYPEFMNTFCESINRNEGEHRKCVECDRVACLNAQKKGETYIYRCRHGLTEAVSPLYNFGTLSGFLMMGQVATNENDKKNAEKALCSLNYPDSAIKMCTKDIPVVDEEMVSSYVKIMTICAEYLTLSHAVSAQKSSIAERAKKYINENIENKFGIAKICASLDCSKSTLLTSFKRTYGVTVNNYITDVRLERAKLLLLNDKKSISDVAYECGFADQSYFSKVFSKRFGLPPSEFRTNEKD